VTTALDRSREVSDFHPGSDEPFLARPE